MENTNATFYLRDGHNLRGNLEKLPELIRSGLRTPIIAVEIDEGCTEIPTSVFSGQDCLTCVKLPDSVPQIGEYAFSHCSKLQSITIPNSVREIRSYAFYGCKKLNPVALPEHVKLAENAFDQPPLPGSST